MGKKIPARDPQFLLPDLLMLAERLGIEVRREALGDAETEVKSGLAMVDGRPILFLDSRIGSREAVEVFVRELRAYPLEDVYLKPALRDLLCPDREG